MMEVKVPQKHQILATKLKDIASQTITCLRFTALTNIKSLAGMFALSRGNFSDTAV
jgi:hypothetical protein